MAFPARSCTEGSEALVIDTPDHPLICHSATEQPFRYGRNGTRLPECRCTC
jgi:hypothetical protein